MTAVLTAEGALLILASVLLYTGTRLALFRPVPSSGTSNVKEGPDDNQVTLITRAILVVVVMTVILVITAAAAGISIGHLSLLGIFLTLSAILSSVIVSHDYGTAARISWPTGMILLSAAWLAWPGWLTASALAAMITIQSIPLLQFAWSFRSLALTGLALAFGYDAVQVWFTHQMTSSGRTVQQWLPIMFYAPSATSLHAPPMLILGLGDIVIPAVLVIAAGRVARQAGHPGILYAALITYAGALATAFAVLLINHGAALPVTVFTIPAIVAVVYLASSRYGARSLLTTAPQTWAEPGCSKEDNPADHTV